MCVHIILNPEHTQSQKNGTSPLVRNQKKWCNENIAIDMEISLPYRETSH